MPSNSSSRRRSTASSKPASVRHIHVTHPVDLYARRVLGDGDAGDPIVAGPLVRQACARHLRDRETGAARGLIFDTAKADHALEFFPQYMRFADGLHAGEPFVLELWQQFIIGSIFGWVDRDGVRRFRTAYLEVGKGNGKTPMLAG